MPQTVEAISHARAAEVPIVVAVTKVDRDNADPTRVRQQLTENELVPEEWGGDTIVVDVSAPDGPGCRGAARRASSLVADIELAEDLVANPKKPAVASVLEAHLDQGRGPVVSALVEEGTLRVGDTIVAGRRVGPRPGDVRRVGQAGHRSRSVGAGRGARSRRRADGGRRSAGRPQRQGRPHRRRGPRPPAQGRRAAQPAHARWRRPARRRLRGGAARRGRHAEPRREGRRRKARSKRSPTRCASSTRSTTKCGCRSCTAASVASPSPTRASRSCRTRRSSASTCVPTARPVSWPSRKTWRCVSTRSSTTCSKTSTTRSSACSSPSTKKSSPAKPRCARCSASRASARSRVASSRTASSPVARRCGSCATARSSGRAPIASLRRFKDDVREVREGFECGIGLENYSDLKPGDVIETFEEREIARV